MLKQLLTNRLFIGALAFFVIFVVGCVLYLRHVEREAQQGVSCSGVKSHQIYTNVVKSDHIYTM